MGIDVALGALTFEEHAAERATDWPLDDETVVERPNARRRFPRLTTWAQRSQALALAGSSPSLTGRLDSSTSPSGT